MVASYDVNAFRYNISIRFQNSRVEIIQDFKEIIKEHLRFYKKKNGVLPDKMLYYRDGVSESQFDQVMAHERNAMAQACAEFAPGYEKKVKMTVVIVQKRHHTRFFPGSTGVGQDDKKNNNVPAGTIVDTVITRPNENQFYLVSHQSIQGVARPTKYCILLDEGDHKIDDIQELTNNVNLFFFCSKHNYLISNIIYAFSYAICFHAVTVLFHIQLQHIMPTWLHIVVVFTSSKFKSIEKKCLKIFTK